MAHWLYYKKYFCERRSSSREIIQMPHHICTTCGTQFVDSPEPPEVCLICLDERQYIGFGGQQWSTLDQIRRTHYTVLQAKEPGLIGIGMTPKFAIGQRALLIRTQAGNVLWDCIPLIDDSLVDSVRAMGGISGIAISHPHYYTTMAEWSRIFDCPIFLHAADREWIMRPDPAIQFWDGETRRIGGGLTLIRCGGHFEGGTVLHWLDGAEGKGALLSGDIIQVVPDRRWVSFMHSYPNLIPLPAAKVRKIVEAVEPFGFDWIYGAWWDLNVIGDGKAAVRRSAERYIHALENEA